MRKKIGEIRKKTSGRSKKNKKKTCWKLVSKRKKNQFEPMMELIRWFKSKIRAQAKFFLLLSAVFFLFVF